MDISRSNEWKLRKIMLAYLVASPFISGYLFFIKLEAAGIVIDLFRIGLIFCFFISCCLLITEKYIPSQLLKPGKISLVAWFLLILGVGVGHVIFQGFLPGGFSELAIIASNLLFFLCLVLCIRTDQELWDFTVISFKYTGIIVALISYFEIFTGFVLPSSRFNEIEYYKNLSFHPATSIFANENNLAAFFLIVTAIIIWQMLHETKRRLYGIQCVQLIIVIMPAVVADSTIFKLGIVFLTIMACTLFLITNYADRYSWRKSGIQMLIPLFLCYIFKKFVRMGFIFISLKISHQGDLLSNAVIKKLIQGDGMVEQLQNTGMGTVTMRKNLFYYGIDAGKAHPFWGNGANSFSNIFQHNADYLVKTGNIINPHNFLVEIFVQYGGIAVVLFLSICILTLALSIKTAVSREAAKDMRYRLGLVAIMIVAFAITTVMPSSFFKGSVYFIPIFFAAIGCDFMQNKDKEK